MKEGEIMEKYKDMSLRKKLNLKMIRNLAFFLCLIIFTFWYILKDQDLKELISVIQSVKITYIILGAFLMLLVYLTEAYNVRSVLVALKERKLPMLKALKFTWIGFFFSAITPAATGGQPIEVYYMSKEKISVPNGTMAMLLQLCSFQISTIALSIICAILNPSMLRGSVIWFYILGIGLNGLALTFMMIGVFSKKLTKKLVNIIIKLLKLVKVKHVDKKIEKIEEGLKQYNESSKFILSHKIEFIKSIIRVFIQVIFYHSIPFCIYKAFGLTNYNFIQIFSMQAVLYTTVSSIPLPGAIGVSETLFLKIYGIAFGKELLKGAMLLYRFISFYLYILISASVVVVNAIKMKNTIGEIDKDVKEIEGNTKIFYTELEINA